MRARPKHETIGWAALTLSALLGLGRSAAAEPEAVRVDYLAPAGCPDATAFMRSLQERTTRFRQAQPGEESRRFVVRVTAVAPSFAGRLEIHNPDGSTAVRSVEGPICDELASALALMTALVIDPDARSSPAKPAAASPAEPSSSAPAEPDTRPVPQSTEADAVAPPPAAQSATTPWRWSVGLHGHATLGLAPNPGLGGQVFVETEAPAAAKLGPALRAGILFEQSDFDLASPVGAEARFQWVTASLEACPLRLSSADLRWALTPCLALHAGVLRAQGRRISQPKQAMSPWSDVGPVLRVRLAATARLVLEAQGGLVVALTRPTFEILDVASRTTAAAYSLPLLGGSVGIGAGYRFR